MSSRALRVAFLLRKFPKLSETFILNQITGLLDAGHDVEMFALRPNPDEADTVHREVESYDLLARTHYLNMPPAPAARIGGALRRLAHLPHAATLLRTLDARRYGREATSLGLLYAVAPFLEAPRYDLIHCQFGTLAPLLLHLRTLGAIPSSTRLVVSFRGSDLTKDVHAQPELFRRLFGVTDLVLPVCEAFRPKLVEHGCDERRIRVHHSAIALEKFTFRERRRAPGEATAVVSIGRFVEKKGFLETMRAVGRLHARGVPLRYTLIGDGELRADLEALRDELGLGGVVEFLGWRRHDEVLAVLERAHLLAAPSVTADDGDQEGIPNVLKEAMALGMPVLATVHSGIPELVDDGVSGYLVPEGDVGALTAALERLCGEPERWPAMGRAGRAKVEAEFASDPLNARLIDLYRDLVDGPPAPPETSAPA